MPESLSFQSALDTLGPETLAHLYSHFAGAAVRNFNASTPRYCAPQLLVLELSEQDPRVIENMAAFSPEEVHTFFEDESGRAHLEATLRALLSGDPLQFQPLVHDALHQVHLVVQINESWVTTAKPEALGLSTPAGQRAEAIVVALHSPLGTFMGVNPIADAPKRHASVGPLLLRNAGAGGRPPNTPLH
jgi:hypothetical protein